MDLSKKSLWCRVYRFTSKYNNEFWQNSYYEKDTITTCNLLQSIFIWFPINAVFTAIGIYCLIILVQLLFTSAVFVFGAILLLFAGIITVLAGLVVASDTKAAKQTGSVIKQHYWGVKSRFCPTIKFKDDV